MVSEKGMQVDHWQIGLIRTDYSGTAAEYLPLIEQSYLPAAVTGSRASFIFG
ncbi:hypothetical protein [Herbaspirillum sp. GCM10030257]|uniref:hypothetical protein n=1 Tax=Herbaspirillum sp. GCM10030257 TaxID=3273393 RepID=UPI0036D26A5A